MLEMVGLTKRHAHDGPLALDGVSLCVRPGRRVVLLGANGSGKTTLTRMANGSMLPDKGSLLLDGDELSAEGMRGLARCVGYLRQDPSAQFVSPQVLDDVAFGPRNLGLGYGEAMSRAEDALRQVGLAGLAGRNVATLSGGQRQRIALAGVLAMGPRYLVMDEPCSQLDPASRQRLREVVRGLLRDGVGMLEATHLTEDVVTADEVVVLSAGRVAWRGTPQELFASRDALRVAQQRSWLARSLHGLVASGFDLGALASSDMSSWASVMAEFVRRGHVAENGTNPRRLAVKRPQRAPSEDCLRLRNVSLSYGDARVLDGIGLELRPGMLALLVGGSGAGKSSLARVASGLLVPDSGEATLGGEAVRAGRVGLSLQRPEDQLFAPSVLEDVAFGPLGMGLGSQESEALAGKALTLMGVGERLWHRDPFALSGGERRRVALAGSLALEPDVLVLDEPGAGLDGVALRDLTSLLRSLADQGRAILVITHDLSDWLGVADSLALLDSGRLVWQGTMEELSQARDGLRRAGLELPLALQLQEALHVQE